MTRFRSPLLRSNCTSEIDTAIAPIHGLERAFKQFEEPGRSIRRRRFTTLMHAETNPLVRRSSILENEFLQRTLQGAPKMNHAPPHFQVKLLHVGGIAVSSASDHSGAAGSAPEPTDLAIHFPPISSRMPTLTKTGPLPPKSPSLVCS